MSLEHGARSIVWLARMIDCVGFVQIYMALQLHNQIYMAVQLHMMINDNNIGLQHALLLIICSGDGTRL